MGENSKSKRQYTGCACRCGQPTYATYLPGHDAKHVSRLVAWVVESWGQGGYETGTRWTSAVNQLPSYQLQSKFRLQMINRARKHLDSTATEMMSEGWQQASHLHHMIGRIDNVCGAATAVDSVALIAAAMGMSRHSVNVRNS